MYSEVAPPDEYLESCSSNTSECQTNSECSEDIKTGKDTGSGKKSSHVSSETWQKFQRLKERRREMCKPFHEKRKQKHTKSETGKVTDHSSETQKKNRSQILSENKNAWKELCQNIDVNAHLTQDNRAKEKAKSKLEGKLDDAVKKGNFSVAEAISDEITQQQLGVKIAGAVKARDYKKRKETEGKFQQAKKKKKLIWGFEQKERWESKGNM